ncbi:hypothetical protein Tco_0639036, partial [Tanacetum coccineum]
TSSRSGNDAHADDANIIPIYDEEPMAEVQTTAEINIFATRQQHIEQLEFNNEGEVDQNVEQCHDTCPLPAKLTDNYITEHSYQFHESENICLKKTVAQFQKDFSRMEAHCVNLELKYQNQVLKEGQHGQFLEVQVQETKLSRLDVFMVKNIWGNMSFDFATCSAQEGTWMSTNTDLLFMSIYAPQDISRKRHLWSYVSGKINRWHGEVLVMGDFKREQDRRSLQDQIIDIDLRLDKGVGSIVDVADRANAFWSIVKIMGY